MIIYQSKFSLGDRVYVDGCCDLVMTVTAILWRCEREQVECSWMSGGAHTAWIEPWRLALYEARR